MKCDEIVSICREEVVATETLLGKKIIAGVFLKNESIVFRFMGVYGAQLLSPTRYSFLTRAFKCDDVDSICAQYNKAVFSFTLLGIYLGGWHLLKMLFFRTKNTLYKAV